MTAHFSFLLGDAVRPLAVARLPSPALPPPPPLLTLPEDLQAQHALPYTPPPPGVHPREGERRRVESLEIFQGKGWSLYWTNTARLSFLFTSTF